MTGSEVLWLLCAAGSVFKLVHANRQKERNFFAVATVVCLGIAFY